MHYPAALEYFEQARTGYQKLGNPHFLADTCERIGATHAAIGDHDAARSAWQEALQLFRTQHELDARTG